MPVKEKVNKSAEIRKLHASGVKSAAEIVSKLKTHNIKVDAGVGLQRARQQKGQEEVKEVQATSRRFPSEKVTVIDHAVVFVKAAGGMQGARDLLSKLALLKN